MDASYQDLVPARHEPALKTGGREHWVHLTIGAAGAV
jgi:hypothetical protein